MRSVTPLCITSRPSARFLITRIASDKVASEVGWWPITRSAESPRPMPHTVRLPNISLRVANCDAMTDQSLVPGVDDERLLPQHMRVERPAVAEPAILGQPHHVHDAAGRRVGLQDEPEIHRASPLSGDSGVTHSSGGAHVTGGAAGAGGRGSSEVLAELALEEPAVA